METQTEVSGSCDRRFQPVREAFERNFREHGEVGASLAISVAGESVVDLWGGWKDRARSQPWERDTIVNVWSTTKGITSLATHMLVDRGLLDPAVPVARYWPEFAQAGKERLLVRWVLTHQAGLTTVDGPLPDGAALDWEFMTSALARQRPYWEPGTSCGYHGVTFGWLLGEILRRTAGRTLKDWVRDEIALPLGADFSIGCTTADDARCADVLYPSGESSAKPSGVDPAFDDPHSLNYRSTELLITPPINADVNSRAWRDAEFGAMNGHSNGRAVARIYGALACGGALNGTRLLQPDTLERAIAPAFEGFDDKIMMLPFPVRRSLGFALADTSLGDRRGSRSFGHSGAGGSLGFADPDAGIGFGYVMNQMWPFDLSNPDPRALGLIDALYSSLE